MTQVYRSGLIPVVAVSLALSQASASQTKRIVDDPLLRGAIEVSSSPDGTLLILTIDLPLDGKFDGLPDQAFILVEGKEFIDRVKGRGTVLVDGAVLELAVERGSRWFFGSKEALSKRGDAADAKAKVVHIDRFRRYWAPSKDPRVASGGPGTGTTTHLALETGLFASRR
jgi:hypothetical protein